MDVNRGEMKTVKLSNFPKSGKIGWKFLEGGRRECE